MKIVNEFTVHTPIENAWRVLTDLEGIAPCLPGARLTGVEGDVYQGKVKVKVGPVISEFAGTARFAEKDDAAHRAVIDAKGRDARSAGNAAALVTAVLTAAGESTQVSVDTDLKISGKLAQFGSGMIKEVSGKLLAQFVANLEAKLAGEDAPRPAPGAEDAAPTPAAAGADDAVAATAAGSAPAASLNGSDAGVSAPAAFPVNRAAGPANDAPAADEAPSAPAAFPVNRANGAATDPPAAPETTTPAAPASPVPARQTPAAPAAGAPAPAAGPATDDDPEPLDLLGIAGGSIYKRVVPLVAGVVVVGAVIAWIIVRR